MLGTLQEMLRLHQVRWAPEAFIHACGAWDPQEDPHLPDILSAFAIPCAGGRLMWGEMGLTVRETERPPRGEMLPGRAGARVRPFPGFARMR